MGIHGCDFTRRICCRTFFFQIVKRMEVAPGAIRRSHFFCQLLEFVFPNFQQPAVGVVDDDELLRIQEVMRNDQ